jgi:hypothetical protein
LRLVQDLEHVNCWSAGHFLPPSAMYIVVQEMRYSDEKDALMGKEEIVLAAVERRGFTAGAVPPWYRLLAD